MCDFGLNWFPRATSEHSEQQPVVSPVNVNVTATQKQEIDPNRGDMHTHTHVRDAPPSRHERRPSFTGSRSRQHHRKRVEQFAVEVHRKESDEDENKRATTTISQSKTNTTSMIQKDDDDGAAEKRKEVTRSKNLYLCLLPIVEHETGRRPNVILEHARLWTELQHHHTKSSSSGSILASSSGRTAAEESLQWSYKLLPDLGMFLVHADAEKMRWVQSLTKLKFAQVDEPLQWQPATHLTTQAEAKLGKAAYVLRGAERVASPGLDKTFPSRPKILAVAPSREAKTLVQVEIADRLSAASLCVALQTIADHHATTTATVEAINVHVPVTWQGAADLCYLPLLIEHIEQCSPFRIKFS